MAQLLTRERLGMARTPRRVLAHWKHQDPFEAAQAVCRDVLDGGTCLPMIWFCGGLVVPVVSWDFAALAARRNAGLGPMLYRSVLADRLEHGRNDEPAVLEMDAFISLASFPSARNALAAVSGYAQAVAAVPRPPGADDWCAFECDYYGFTVAEVDGHGARIVVDGLRQPKHPAGGVNHQRLLMKEQLFDVALRAGVMPATF